jgi:hypothetical protein
MQGSFNHRFRTVPIPIVPSLRFIPVPGISTYFSISIFTFFQKGGGTPNLFTVSQMSCFRGLHLKSLFFLQAFTGY